MKLKEIIKEELKVIYEYISIPNEIVKKYSKNIFDNKPKLYHITTQFAPKEANTKYYGSTIKFKVVAYGVSDLAEAIKVKIISEVPFQLKDNLHITLTFKNKPVDSNYITNWKPVKDETIYEGIFNGFVK